MGFGLEHASHVFTDILLLPLPAELGWKLDSAKVWDRSTVNREMEMIDGKTGLALKLSPKSDSIQRIRSVVKSRPLPKNANDERLPFY